jgi:hypothetical protein
VNALCRYIIQFPILPLINLTNYIFLPPIIVKHRFRWALRKSKQLARPIVPEAPTSLETLAPNPTAAAAGHISFTRPSPPLTSPSPDRRRRSRLPRERQHTLRTDGLLLPERVQFDMVYGRRRRDMRPGLLGLAEGPTSVGTGSSMGQRASAANPSVPAKLDQHLEKTKSQSAESR